MQVMLATIDYFDDGPLGFGFSDPEAWENMVSVLNNMGMISGKTDIDKVYTNDFVQ